MPQALLDYLAPKRILLLGFGREGRSTYQYIRRHFPEKDLAIADQNPVTLEDAHVTVHCGPHYLESVNHYDLVMKSPGITVRELELSSSVEMTCQLDLFLRFARCRGWHHRHEGQNDHLHPDLFDPTGRRNGKAA